jgi:hypothetical protein
MADTTYQRDIEEWIQSEWLAEKYGQSFDRRDVPLTSGGKYRFAAVSEDRSIVAIISTSASRTSSGSMGVGKLLRIRSGILYLLMAKNVERRLLLLTERDMWDACRREQERGRFPQEIEIEHVPIPAKLSEQLSRGRKVSSEEVTPSRSRVRSSEE